MNNFRQLGDVLTLTAPDDISSGRGALVGSIFGVATADVASGEAGEFKTTGVFVLAKTSAQTWTEGVKVYWDDTNGRCDTDSTVGQLIGVATAAAANPSSTGYVRLNGSAPSTAEGPQAAIVSLTDSTGGSGTHDDTLADGLTSVAPAAYAAHAAGAVAVTSNAATDLDTTAAAVANLRGVTATLVTDVTILNQNTSDLGQKVNEILAALRAAGIITT